METRHNLEGRCGEAELRGMDGRSPPLEERMKEGDWEMGGDAGKDIGTGERAGGLLGGQAGG